MTANCNDDRLTKIGKELYLKPAKADVYFLIEATGERIPAHKILLSSASNVFNSMFYGALKEKGDIKIVDASAGAFKEFLQFFYMNKVELITSNTEEIMYLVHKYDVLDGKESFAEAMTTKIKVENVTSILHLAIIYDHELLLQMCETIIRENFHEVLKSTDFLNCDRQVLAHILKMENSFLRKENDVFEACMAWVKVKSKREKLTREIIQTYLGETFYEICFGSMTLNEFAAFIPSYGDLFSVAEYKEILQIFSKSIIRPKIFKKLIPTWDERNVITCTRCERNENDSSESIQAGEVESVTTFSSNKMLMLGYFTCAPLVHQHSSEDGSIRSRVKILDDSNQVISEFNFDHTRLEIVSVHLPMPIIIEPSIKYEIRLAFEMTSYSVSYLLKTTVHLEHDIVVHFHDPPYTVDKVMGLITQLGFNLID